MAIHETKKQTDLEKRLRLLRQQIYGKESKWEVGSVKIDNDVRSEKSHFPLQVPTSHISLPTSDIKYLYHDLIKIGILATFALGAQIILFYLLQNNLLKNLL